MSRAKYGNHKTVVDGITFHSAKEARRYGDLKLLERAGEITALELQPKFPMVVNGQLVCTYLADFAYVNVRTGIQVTEDVKGVETEAFKIKRKLLRAVHGVEVVLT